MTRYVFDAWAWVEYMGGSNQGRKAERAMSANEVWTSVVSLAELVSKFARTGMESKPVVDAVTSLSRLGVPDVRDAEEAGEIHARIKATSPNFSLPDSFVLQLARKVGGRVLTGDPEFRGITEAEFLE